MVVEWMLGGVGYHAMSKDSELSYKIGYGITSELFFPVCLVCPDFPVRPNRQYPFWLPRFI